MVRAVARVLVGLWMTLVVVLSTPPTLSSAAAPLPGLSQVTFPSPTTVTTTPPSTSSASVVTPTTKKTTGTTRPRNTGTTTPTTIAATTVAPTTTVASLPAAAPPPVTLPLAVASQSGSIGSFFPILGGIGLVVFIALVATQWFLTKPGHRGPTL